MKVDGFFELFRAIRRRTITRAGGGEFTNQELGTEAFLDAVSILGLNVNLEPGVEAELLRREDLVKSSPAYLSANQKVGEMLRAAFYGS